MPVLVVPGGTRFAARLCEALLATGGQVRAYVYDADGAERLRAHGVHVAAGGPLDVERLEAACAQVHTLVHLTGEHAGRAAGDEAEALEVTAVAADAADVARVVVAAPAAGRVRRRVEAGLGWLDRRCFEPVVVTGDDEDALLAAILAADAR